jgi:hypothetical protein
VFVDDLAGTDVAVEDGLVRRATSLPALREFGLDALVGEVEEFLAEEVVLVDADVVGVLGEF